MTPFRSQESLRRGRPTAPHSSNSQPKILTTEVNYLMRWGCSSKAYLTTFRRRNCSPGCRHPCWLMAIMLATKNTTIKIFPIIRRLARKRLCWKIMVPLNSWVLNLSEIQPLLRVRRSLCPLSRQIIKSGTVSKWPLLKRISSRASRKCRCRPKYRNWSP